VGKTACPPYRTYFAYDEAGHLLGEYTQAGTAIQETVWLGDIPVAVLNSTGNYYIYPDHLNTPRAIADSTNKTVWRWKDPAFGNGQPDQDPDKDGKAFVYNLRFPGQYYDQSTGLHYNWFRDYDPVTGRYLKSDPIGLQGGLNTYSYVNGNPVNFIDPLGLFKTINCSPKKAQKIENACPIAQDKADIGGVGLPFSDVLDNTTFDCKPPP
jgi:RHS repeat-associated protein